MRRLRKDIFGVGYIDWDLRNFHGYFTSFGSTYNAILLLVIKKGSYRWGEVL